MKNLLTITCCFFLFQILSAQEDIKIVYDETIKLEFEGMDEKMVSMLPTSQSLKKELLHKNGMTIYQNMKGEAVEDLEMESDDGSFKIQFVSDDIEDILFKNLNEKSLVHQKGIMGKSFVVTNDLPKLKWKITNEKIKYLDYECQKAVIEDEDKFVVAWFTSQIPMQMGPAMYHGLPGTILMVSVNDGKKEIKALSVEKIDLPKLEEPSKGKKVSEEKYQKIQEEKMKEMQEMHGAETIEIRN